MLETLAVLAIGYLKLSLICVPIVAAIAVYDLRRYPMCAECRDNLLTRRPRLFSPLAKCQLHGWVAV